MKVAVIGAGYAGMAAAVTLAEGDVAPTVFEAGRVPGGRARRVDAHDLALDNGLHILVGAYRETLRLIERVHPEGRLPLLRLPLEWVIHGEFRLRAASLPAPLHLVAGLLLARGASVGDRLSALRFMLKMRRAGFELETDVPVNELLDRFGQSTRIRGVLWHPLCAAALNTPPAQASARVFLRVLRDTLAASRDQSDLVLARTDLSALFPEPAAAYVEARGGVVRAQCRVTAIDPLPGGFGVTAAGRSEMFSHVICALPSHQVNAFLASISALAGIVETMNRFTYQPIYSVYLRYPQRVRLPVPMLGFLTAPAHWVFDRELLCGHTGVVGAVISAEGPHQDLAHDELAQRVHRQLVAELGELPAPLWTQVIAEKRAAFACTPGLARPPQRTPLPNLLLAGDYTEGGYPATLEAAVRSGVTAANIVLGKA